MTSPAPEFLRGTYYVVPTAFAEDGSLDLSSQRRVADAAVGWGVDGLLLMGVMGEPSALSSDERRAVLRASSDGAAGRVPVVVGCSAASASLALELIGEARDAGAAAVMVAPPPMLRNIDLLPAYYQRLARGGGLPLVVQDEPAATDVLLPVSSLIRITVESGARCIKLEDPPTPRKVAALLAADPSLLVFGGLGGISALWELMRGACGTMTGFAYPEVLRAMRLALDGGDDARAAAIFYRFLPLIVFEAQPIVGLLIRKEILRRRGVLATGVTRGLSPSLDRATALELDQTLQRLGIAPSTAPLPV
jgi:4-hydroxy-tetrahydrodipicolinate synthase